MKKVYITHCSAKKDQSLKGKLKKVEPFNLYTATPTQRFMKKCQRTGVNWAIFSDKYGIWRSNEKHPWYEKNPNKVSDEEFKTLLNNFNTSLSEYAEIWFYYNPGRFHPLYEKLLKNTSLKSKIRKFTHLDEIVS
jgi:hypothetical protein